MTNSPRPTSIIVGGKCEFIYLKALWANGHPWADLSGTPIQLYLAEGDSKVPALVNERLAAGDEVCVLYDSDALERRHEQAQVISREHVTVEHLGADFEGLFDPEIVQMALKLLGYEAEIPRLAAARSLNRPFEEIKACAVPTENAKHLEKVSLAGALAEVSERYWYVPVGVYRLLRHAGEVCGIGRSVPGQQRWLVEEISAVQSSGTLYVGNHVTNTELKFWDFANRKSKALALPGCFYSTISMCQGGKTAFLRNFVHGDGHINPTSTWIHMCANDGTNIALIRKFQLSGNVHGLLADEDGQHLLLQVTKDGKTYGLRCLKDGTQHEGIELAAPLDLSIPKSSRSKRFKVSGAKRLELERQGAPTLVLPHFRANSYVFSRCERFLAFHGRRWIEPPDYLWIYDIQEDRIHRVALGEHFIPVYWA